MIAELPIWLLIGWPFAIGALGLYCGWVMGTGSWTPWRKRG